jgi:hypothetical protein
VACAPCLCNQTRLYNFASPPLSASDSATHLAFGRKPNVSFFAFSAEFFRLPNFRCTSSKDIFYFNSQGSFDPFDGCSSVKDRFLQPEVRKFAFPHYCLSNDFELTEANSRSGLAASQPGISSLFQRTHHMTSLISLRSYSQHKYKSMQVLVILGDNPARKLHKLKNS